MIEVKGLSKVYGKKDNAFTALSAVSFGVPDGASLAIVGKSGSGKSTLMHVMSGLDRLTSGSVKIDGRELSEFKRKEMDRFRARTMGFIFQSFFVEANQTCYQNVVLPLEIAEVPAGRRKNLVEAALEHVGLSEKINQKAKNLSGGQKQRLAIARAIANKPTYIFADEPTGNLDSETGSEIINLLFDLNQRFGSTLCIVTHDLELSARCQFQVLMKDGRVVAAKKKLPARPSTSLARKVKS